MKIYIAADHGGFELKNLLREHLSKAGHDVEDLGAVALDKDDDYPAYAYNLATKVIGEEGDTGRGILICGSGQGMTIAANRINGIRATLAWSPQTAAAARRDDDSNVLALPARYIDFDRAVEVVEAWIKTEFSSDPKYKRRLDEIAGIS